MQSGATTKIGSQDDRGSDQLIPHDSRTGAYHHVTIRTLQQITDLYYSCLFTLVQKERARAQLLVTFTHGVKFSCTGMCAPHGFTLYILHV